MAGGIQFLAGWWIDHPEVPREQVVELAMGVNWIGLERLGEGVRWKRDDPGSGAERRGASDAASTRCVALPPTRARSS